MVIKVKLRHVGTSARARRSYCVGAIALAIGLFMHAGTASAQFVCDSTTPGGAGGATATGPSSMACGQSANATTQAATAIGAFATADGTNSTAIGFSAGAGASGAYDTFVGADSGLNAVGNYNVALGAFAGQEIIGDGNVSIGAGAGTNGGALINNVDDTVSLGTNALASANGAVAIGAGATATRENQFAFGTSLNTYSMAGITSDASRAAQGAPTHIVTSNASGDLAAYTPAELGLASSGDVVGLQKQIDQLGERDNELGEGVAIALAMAQPIFHAGQTFAVNVGWGNFDGQNAVAASAAGLVDRGSLGAGSTVTLYGGVGAGTQAGTVGGRAGLSFGW